VAGVALGDIYVRFTWQALAGVALMALVGALGLVLGACDAAALCVAGVALGDIDVRFTWQAWHNLTSTGFAWQAWHSWHWVARLGWF